MKQILVSAAALGVAIAMTSAPASAGGFFADFLVRPIFGDHAAKEADKIHAQLGNPMDHIGNAAAGTAVGVVTGSPLAGAAVTTTLEARKK